MTDADRCQLQQQLRELEEAKHSLLIGRREASATYNGMSTTFTQTNLAQLNAAIAEIKGKLGLGGRRAIGVRFGR